MQSETVAGIALFLGFHTGRRLAVPPGYPTLGWVGAAFVLFALGFALRARAYRWSGFAALALAAARLIAVDLRRFAPDQRILTLVLGGIALLVVSFVYARRERAPEPELPRGRDRGSVQ